MKKNMKNMRKIAIKKIEHTKTVWKNGQNMVNDFEKGKDERQMIVDALRDEMNK